MSKEFRKLLKIALQGVPQENGFVKRKPVYKRDQESPAKSGHQYNPRDVYSQIHPGRVPAEPSDLADLLE